MECRKARIRRMHAIYTNASIFSCCILSYNSGSLSKLVSTVSNKQADRIWDSAKWLWRALLHN